MKNETALREEICSVGEGLFRRGYTVGSSGNISVRLNDGWLITPTDACLGNIDPARIAKVDEKGNWVNGDKPSKTLLLHQGIYSNNNEVNGVLHTHSTYLVLLTLTGVWSEEAILPPITPYQVMKVGKIPLVKYHRPGDPEVVKIVSAVAEKVRGVMLEKLGPVVWGKTISQASFILEELEETAKLWLKSGKNSSPLTTDNINEIFAVFGSKW